VLSKMFPKLFWKSKKIAVFYLSTEPYLATKFSTWKMNWLLLDLHRSFCDLVKELQHFQPEILVGSVQTLCELAKLQLSGKILLRCYHIIATAEVLTPLAENLIKSTFKQDVHQLYQCAEGSLGMTCKYGTMHLNEDEFYIEKAWIDHKRQRFVPVITTLKRALHPLIRYRMEDILVLRNSPCLCGNPALAIERIVGRCEDVLYFKQRMSSRLKPIYADTLNHVLSEVAPFVHQYQILQHSMRHLVVKIIADDFTLAENAMTKQLRKLWELEIVQPPQMEFVKLEPTRLDQMFRTTKRLEKTAVPF
ncbi:MAG TPA: hypothetical protein PLD88_12870, partial [Candidatus Berkiella sp.]|nr:hypothetical protein [Candidatus Berkiella sp.]